MSDVAPPSDQCSIDEPLETDTWVFINYRRADVEVAAWHLYKALSRALKGKVFFDQREIPAGADYDDHLDQRLRDCRVLIVVIGLHWLRLLAEPRNGAKDWVRHEIKTALDLGKKVIPVLVESSRPVTMPQADQLPDDIKELARKQAIKVRIQDEVARDDLERLVSEVGSELLAVQRLEEATSCLDSNEFATAAQKFEEAARLAHTAADASTEAHARLQAVRAWAHHFSSTRAGYQVPDDVIAVLLDHANVAESLGASLAKVATTRMLIAEIKGDMGDVLYWADELSRASADASDQVEALIFRLQALWRLERQESALALAGDVRRWSALVDGEERLVLTATWLATLSKADQLSEVEIAQFASDVRDMLGRESISRLRANHVLGQLGATCARNGQTDAARAIFLLAYEIAEPLGDRELLCQVALDIAELAVEVGDADEARVYFDRGIDWASRWPGDNSSDAAEDTAISLRAHVFVARGEGLVRLTDNGDCAQNSVLLNEAREALVHAASFLEENHASLRGEVKVIEAHLQWLLGCVLHRLGRMAEAAEHFRQVRSPAAMAHRRFASDVGARSWLAEAQARYFAGDPITARDLTEQLLGSSCASREVATHARSFQKHLQEHVLPLVQWFDSDDARAIDELATSTTLHKTIAEQMLPLMSLWAGERAREEINGAILLDAWGRGGFARVAAAVRAKPHRAISVDARSVEEIRHLARLFCPLFDTVIIKWKGKLNSGEAMFLVPDARFGVGGHGYILALGSKTAEGEFAALGWANWLPSTVAAFLSGEAYALVRAGRLVVLPAPLVGCSQSAVGWTDYLLTDCFLHGVVNAVRGHADPSKSRERTIDLTSISIPFVDNVELADLAVMLDEIGEKRTRPLQKVLDESIYSENLRWENWTAIRAIENDIQDAFDELGERFGELARQRGNDWNVAHWRTSFSASEGKGDAPGHEPVTDLLRALAPFPQGVAPWIPYWCLTKLGGNLDWSGRIDNRTVPPDESADPEIPRVFNGWLYPGTPGWAMLLVRRS